MSDPLSGATIERRLRDLAGFTDVSGEMTRLTLSQSHKNAVAWLGDRFRTAGMTTRVDALGTLVGRYAPAGAGPKTLLIGSHIDTVRDAGIYDGTLGVMIGLSVVESLCRSAIAPPVAIEVVAFGDEEGVRFPTTLTGSKAMAGRFDPRWLDDIDAAGIRRRGALAAFGAPPLDPDALACDPSGIAGYLEVHIEQGPVLEAAGQPLGIVTAINGVSRGFISIRGVAGHAGTLPMDMRRDALATAAEIILAAETLARNHADLVATVGVIDVPGAAINVVPGRAGLTFDIRSPDDSIRHNAVAAFRTEVEQIARRRKVEFSFDTRHDAAATPCDAALSCLLEQAVRNEGVNAPRLPSGAGHDAMSFRGVAPIAMLFIRCKDGVSHNPAESADEVDVELAARVIRDFVLSLSGR